MKTKFVTKIKETVSLNIIFFVECPIFTGKVERIPIGYSLCLNKFTEVIAQWQDFVLEYN